MRNEHTATGERQELAYSLDNSAVFMASVAGPAEPFVFRLSAELDAAVSLPELTAALDSLRPRFPTFFVGLRKGVFWHYLGPLPEAEVLEPEEGDPCAPMGRGRCLVRVIPKGRRVSCEFHHVVTDGMGGLSFLKSLIVEYLRLRGGTALPGTADYPGILRPESAPQREELEDSYGRIFRDGVPMPEKAGRSFTIPGRRMERAYRVTRGVLPSDTLHDAARRRGATVTDLLVAAHFAALQELRAGLPDTARIRRRWRLSVQVPVDLRRIYGSRTLRNFFLFAAPQADLRLGTWSFDELLRRAHHETRLGLEGKELLRQVRRNVGGQRNPVARPVLLPLKDLVLRIVNATIGASSYSGSLSNLGVVELPRPFADHVTSFEFVPPRSKTVGANIGVVAWKGRTRICVGSTVADLGFERAFFRGLAGLGLPVALSAPLGTRSAAPAPGESVLTRHSARPA